MAKLTIGSGKSNKLKQYNPDHQSNKDHRARRLLRLLSKKLKALEAKPSQIIKELGIVEKTIEKEPTIVYQNTTTSIESKNDDKILDLENQIKILLSKMNEQKDVIEDVKDDEHNDSIHIEGLEAKVDLLEKKLADLESLPQNISQITRIEYKTSRPLMYLCVFNLLFMLLILILK